MSSRDAATPGGQLPDENAPREKPPAALLYPAATALLVAAVVVALVKYEGSGCGRARIVSPAPGTRTSETVAIRIEVEKPECVKQVVYRVGETEVARTRRAESEVRIDPDRLGLRVPGTYAVSVAVEGRDGRTYTPEPVSLTLTGKEKEVPAPEPQPPVASPSRERLRALSKGLTAEIKGRGDYVFEDEFVDEIGRHVPDFKSEVTAHTAARRSTVERAFNDQGLAPALGLALAASLGASDSASIKKLAAEMRQLQLQFSQIDGDFMYAVACHGMKLRDVAEVYRELKKYGEADRRNFWLMKERLKKYLPRDAGERVARLFAAGIVVKNPREFD